MPLSEYSSLQCQVFQQPCAATYAAKARRDHFQINSAETCNSQTTDSKSLGMIACWQQGLSCPNSVVLRNWRPIAVDPSLGSWSLSGRLNMGCLVQTGLAHFPPYQSMHALPTCGHQLHAAANPQQLGNLLTHWCWDPTNQVQCTEPQAAAVPYSIRTRRRALKRCKHSDGTRPRKGCWGLQKICEESMTNQSL